MDYPELAARTEGYPAGEPHSITVSGDGSRVVFLRSATDQGAAGQTTAGHTTAGRSTTGHTTAGHTTADQLWVLDVATGSERMVCDAAALECGPGIDSYAADAAGLVVAMAAAGTLLVTNLSVGSDAGVAGPRSYATSGPVLDPRPDPAGGRVAYVAGGALHVIDLGTDEDTMLAAEPDHHDVSWGMAEPVAMTQFRRDRGYWWSPDGASILAARVDSSRVSRWHIADPSAPERAARSIRHPAAGTANAEVTLHVLDLDGGWVDVHWDRETYPYLVSVSWSDVGGPLVTVLRRLQQHGLVLAVDPRTGETQVHAELADPRWVEPIAGSPCYLADGRVLIGGELAHDGYDARCLFADGGLITPTSLYVRRVCGRLGHDLLVEASEGEPSEQHLYRVTARSTAAPVGVHRLTPKAGWHVGHAGGETLVIGATSLDHAGTRWSVHAPGAEITTLRSTAAASPLAPRPALERVTDRRLPAGVLYPRTHVAGRRLPVLVDINGGPGRQEVLAARSCWLRRQWWADAGFAVVVIDNRGTPGVAPSFEKAIHRRLADVVLADQVDALGALAAKHPDLDLARVAIRGRRFGGWLAALGVLSRPDVYRCAVADTPITDWSLHEGAYTERLLGLPSEAGDVYAHHSLLEAVEPVPKAGEAAGLLLMHDLADEHIPAVHTMRLSAALVAAGRPHSVIPVTNSTRSDSDGTTVGATAQGMLALELDFVRRHTRP